MDELLTRGCPIEVDAHSESSPTKCYGLAKSKEDDDSQSINTIKRLITNTNNHKFVSTGANNDVQCNRKPRGLNNLGNTCYFNSVLQCLAKTPYLTQVLFNTSVSGELITFHVDNENIIVKLEKCSQITINLCTTLQEINKNSSKPSFTPNALLDLFKKKCKMFHGYRQHDSHECLRQLLTLVRDDDLKRYQRSIIHHYGLSMRTSGSKIDEDKTAKFKKFKTILEDVVLCPDQVFKGQLFSVVQCQTCNNKSEMTESFWDLSLPIVSNNEIHSLFTNGNNFQEHELAIQQQIQKKDEDNMLHIQNTLNEVQMSNMENISEDNLKSKYILTKQPLNGSLNSSKRIKIMKSNSLLYNTDHQMVVDNILDNDISADSDLSSSICSSSAPVGSFHNLTLVNNNQSYTKTGTSANTSLECDIPPLNVKNDNTVEFNIDSNMENVNNSQECLKVTLQPLQKCEDDKYSILNCLNKFTAPEVMTDNNKVACQFCTLHMENNTDQQIYTNSVRQTLISSPPATLVLQLKRFQMCTLTTEKITRDVSFPWILDIAPYCSVKCQDKLSPGQNQLLYSLYGVVVHEGEMDCGHYIAYIKEKDSIKNDDHRISFLEGSKMKPPNIIDSNNELCHSVLSGTWYSVSDNIVREVTPDVVQNSQAYLMFYERIL